MGGENVLASAATSASYNMLLQLVFRLLTFLLNAFILRYISKDMLGVVNVRLTLLYTTILFISREAFRRACLSQQTSKTNWKPVINLLWCILPIGILSSLVFSYIWVYMLDQPDPASIHGYPQAVACFALSAIIEMLSEPLFVVAQIFLFVKLKVLIEGISLAVRCTLTVILVLLFPDMGIAAFSIAQLVFTCLYSTLYYVYFTKYVASGSDKKLDNFPFKSTRDFFPTLFTGEGLVSFNLASLVWSFLQQSFLKQILTEGERYVMTVFNILSFADQGVYDVINNLGSLAARFIFLPIEDSSYLFFSQTLMRGQALDKQTKDASNLATNVLSSLLKVVTLIGLTILVFGYSYSHLLLHLYGGSILTSGTGPILLRWYCFYVLLLAINGITECFSFATMSQADVNRYNRKMLVFSLVFLSSSWYLTKQLGSVGFILANCLNMAARITHSVQYIRDYYRNASQNPLRSVLPSATTCLIYILSLVITSISEAWLCCNFGFLWNVLHVTIGGVCLLTVIASIYLTERHLVSFIIQQYKDRHKQLKKAP